MQDEHTSPEQPLPSAQEYEIGGLCRAFEQQWRAGEQPRIEDVLLQGGPPIRAALLT